ncbi:MAG TPA: hypothetical protein VNS32_13390 [Flavisolibacter sp.]|nr:hypothetical protein [Flavisolibacter sp.]
MKKNFLMIILMVILASGCERHYYNEHHEHSERYKHHHHDRDRDHDNDHDHY